MVFGKQVILPSDNSVGLRARPVSGLLYFWLASIYYFLDFLWYALKMNTKSANPQCYYTPASYYKDQKNNLLV